MRTSTTHYDYTVKLLINKSPTARNHWLTRLFPCILIWGKLLTPKCKITKKRKKKKLTSSIQWLFFFQPTQRNIASTLSNYSNRCFNGLTSLLSICFGSTPWLKPLNVIKANWESSMLAPDSHNSLTKKARIGQNGNCKVMFQKS